MHRKKLWISLALLLAAGAVASTAVLHFGAPRSAAPSLDRPATLAAAFAAAFPKGAKEEQQDLDYTLVFTPKRLVALGAGSPVVALFSEGKDPQPECHPCTGTLRVAYLVQDGERFSPASPKRQFDIPGYGFGMPPDWALLNGRKSLIVKVEAGFTGAGGCTELTTSFYRLLPEGVVENKRARQQKDEGCA
jgi:hypothetical protein